MKEEKLIKIGVTFYISSILGFIYELILNLIKRGKYNRGILYGPWLPIYGTGAVLIIILLNKYQKKPYLIFILSFLLTGTLELIIGFILHYFLKMRLWDYTGWFMNIKGYVCLLSAFCFGIGGLLIIYLLKPLIDKLITPKNKKIFKNLLIILTVIFGFDIIATIIK